MQPPASPPPLVLTFAASDPCAGAGLQADLMTLSALGCYPLSVITAVTVQDSVGVTGVFAVAADRVDQQARTLLADMSVAAFKIGLPGSAENIAVIAAIVADYPGVPLVLDPVLASGRGDELAGDESIRALRELLLPRTTVLTPNTLEARRLARRAGDAAAPPLDDCVQRLLALGCEYVLLTGTHAETPRVVNSLYRRDLGLLRSDAWDRLPGDYHGSGCTLASAIAAHLARGFSVIEAAQAAQRYTWQALASAFRPGRGQYLPDRFFRMRSGAGDG